MLDHIVSIWQAQAGILWQCVCYSIYIVIGSFVVGGILWAVLRGLHRRLCEALRDKPGDWWEKLPDRSIKHLCGGVIGYFLWPLLIGLNILFLAVALELFTTGARTVPDWAPYAGTYYVMALVMALLYASAQSFCAIVWGIVRHRASGGSEVSNESGSWALRAWTSVLVVTVLAEAFIAAWRVRIMLTGAQPGLPTMFQNFLETGGIAAAFLIGALVPIFEMLAAYAAFHWLLVPWIVGAGSAAVWAAFGSYEPLPAAAARLKKEVKVPDRRARKLDGRVNMWIWGLVSRGKRVGCPITDDDIRALTDSEAPVQAARSSSAAADDGWESWQHWDGKCQVLEAEAEGRSVEFANEARYKRSTVVRELLEIANKARGKRKPIAKAAVNLGKRLRGFRRRTRLLPKETGRWNDMLDRLDAAENFRVAVEAQVSSAELLRSNISALLKWDLDSGSPDPVQTTSLSDPERRELIQLKQDAADTSPEGQKLKDEAERKLQRCTNEASDAKGKLEGIKKPKLQDIENRLAGLHEKFSARMVLPGVEKLHSWLKALDTLEGRVHDSANDALWRLAQIERNCRNKIRSRDKFIDFIVPPWLR